MFHVWEVPPMFQNCAHVFGNELPMYILLIAVGNTIDRVCLVVKGLSRESSHGFLKYWHAFGHSPVPDAMDIKHTHLF